MKSYSNHLSRFLLRSSSTPKLCILLRFICIVLVIFILIRIMSVLCSDSTHSFCIQIQSHYSLNYPPFIRIPYLLIFWILSQFIFHGISLKYFERPGYWITILSQWGKLLLLKFKQWIATFLCIVLSREEEILKLVLDSFYIFFFSRYFIYSFFAPPPGTG